MISYLLQQKGSCCSVFALVNSLRFFEEKNTPEPGTNEWESLIDLAGCRYGSSVSQKKAAKYLGLELMEISSEDVAKHIPAALTVWNPNLGMALHMVLVVGWKEDDLVMVNYRTRIGPVIETTKPNLPRMGLPVRKCWAILRKEQSV